MSVILPITVFFVLSVIGAFIFFKILFSEAEIKSKQKRIRGALAGFVILYTTLCASYTAFSKNLNSCGKWKPQEWTISGTIATENTGDLCRVSVRYLPPSPAYQIQDNGIFFLYRVNVIPKIGWPRIQFECPDYYPESYEVDPQKDEINYKTRVITIKNPISLENMRE